MLGLYIAVISGLLGSGCKEKDCCVPPPAPSPISLTSVFLGTQAVDPTKVQYQIDPRTPIRVLFNNKLDRSSVAGAVTLTDATATNQVLSFSYERGDSLLVISPASLQALTRYTLKCQTTVKASNGSRLLSEAFLVYQTAVDTTDKFPRISDDALLDKVQAQTFKYFWDYGHPVSGLARERSNSTPETVTSGGSGFGIMTIPVAIHRNFITRAEGLARMQRIVGFLLNTAQRFHGAFPHWLNGTTGVVIPFSAADNGADLVETSYLMAGLLTARQYFSGSDPAETALRTDINALWNAVEWSWFRRSNENALFWHWSPTGQWQMNMKIQGWNECLITYILAASSTTYSIPRVVYTEGFARNGAMANGATYYGYGLPLGPAMGGPLFWSHYSFLGVDPNGLSDAYANYQTQTKNHSLINLEYCKANPRGYPVYGVDCWGLTACDIPGGYSACEPNNDLGVISPTAALSSFPYTPTESMRALKYFYYKLGDKTWSNYGFVDAFSLKDIWFANSHLAIDQGPIVVMIENYRSGLIWNLLSSCPEVKNGLRSLGFTAPYL